MTRGHAGHKHTMATSATPSAADPESAAAAASTTFVLEKQDPNFLDLRARHFSIDEDRGALVYSEDEAQKLFKGAIPLEMINAVTPSKTGVSVDIADRTFVLRPLKGLPRCVRPSCRAPGGGRVAPERRSYRGGQAAAQPLEDSERFRERQRTTKEERGGKLSRQDKNGYPERARPMTFDWAVELPGYTPPSYTSERNACNEPVEPAGVDWSQRASWAGRCSCTRRAAPRSAAPASAAAARCRAGARTLVTKRDAAGGWHVVVVRKAGEQLAAARRLAAQECAAAPPPRQLRMMFALQACRQDAAQRGGDG